MSICLYCCLSIYIYNCIHISPCAAKKFLTALVMLENDDFGCTPHTTSNASPPLSHSSLPFLSSYRKKATIERKEMSDGKVGVDHIDTCLCVFMYIFIKAAAAGILLLMHIYHYYYYYFLFLLKLLIYKNQLRDIGRDKKQKKGLSYSSQRKE